MKVEADKALPGLIARVYVGGASSAVRTRLSRAHVISSFGLGGFMGFRVALRSDGYNRGVPMTVPAEPARRELC